MRRQDSQSVVDYALSRLERFTCGAGRALYRDHLGRRIVADWEGSGEVDFAIGGDRCQVEGDGTFLLVVAEEDVDVDLTIQTGRVEPPPNCIVDEIQRWRIDDEEALARVGFSARNLSSVVELTSENVDGETVTAPVASLLNVARWRLTVPAGVEAIWIVKTYDRFHGRQRARVLIDGEFRGWWYAPFEDRRRRWATTKFATPIGGPREVEIAIDPPAGAPLWSVSEMMVYGLGSPTKMPRPFVPR